MLQSDRVTTISRQATERTSCVEDGVRLDLAKGFFQPQGTSNPINSLGRRTARQQLAFALSAAVAGLLALLGAHVAAAAEGFPDLAHVIAEPILEASLPANELLQFVQARVPVCRAPESIEAWNRYADELRKRLFEEVVFRGQAKKWRETPGAVEQLGEIPGGPGYRLMRLRYEALPGMWIPALLYEPDPLPDRAAVFVHVNGHHADGKSMPHKQRLSINLARRGVLVYDLEFLDMGQLRHDDNRHDRLPQIDLCGTSGLAPFYLALERGLNVALSHPQADPQRVGMAGLSGGGWQTILLSALDPRITLANPVAGYSSLYDRGRLLNDVGDSEQIPVDMGTVADYAHLTALMSPRPLLLTYNATDECCFLPHNVLPRLEQAALPVYRAFGKGENLRAHINYAPGSHNFDADNREALYRLMQTHFVADANQFAAADLAVADDEIKTAEQLAVPMPAENVTLHRLAMELSAALPSQAPGPQDNATGAATQRELLQQRLKALVRWEPLEATGTLVQQRRINDVQVRQWRIRCSQQWTLPAVELTPADAGGAVLLLGDATRAQLADAAARLMGEKKRVLLVDLTGFGEANPHPGGVAIQLIATLGGRPLGVASAQVAAVSRWWRADHGGGSVDVTTYGPRTSLIALVAAGLGEETIGNLTFHEAWPSLREPIVQNLTAHDAPEAFCFGLLEHFDMPQLIALAHPRHVDVRRTAPDR